MAIGTKSVKTNIMYVRNSRKAQSKFWFIFDHKTVPYCTQYKYLGITINQHLDYKVTAEVQCESAGRALASIITKMIKNSGQAGAELCQAKHSLS